jgi:pyruvate/2-oxoglutarate dehydrogenase complex dihydrolipoamide acyltransferase (E2) component
MVHLYWKGPIISYPRAVKNGTYFWYRYHNVNINVAVQTEHGLFVPVIRVGYSKFSY